MPPIRTPSTQPPRWRRSRLLPIALVASLTGCATCSPVVIEPRLPAPAPELMAPPSRDSYSESAQQLLRQWRETLIRTLPGSEAGSTGLEPLKE